MRRDVCSECCALLIAFLIGCSLVSCATKREGRWIEPQSVLGFSSLEEITNTFASYDVIATHGIRTRELSAAGAHFLFVTTIPYTSSSLLSTYCYEQTEPDFWHLRAVLILARVKSVNLEFVPDHRGVNVISEGKTVFTVVSTASEQSKSPGNK